MIFLLAPSITGEQMLDHRILAKGAVRPVSAGCAIRATSNWHVRSSRRPRSQSCSAGGSP
jgi:hypothetical protein